MVRKTIKLTFFQYFAAVYSLFIYGQRKNGGLSKQCVRMKLGKGYLHHFCPTLP